MLIRAYAFSGRSQKILALLCVMCAVLAGVHIWAFGARPNYPPRPMYDLLGGFTGCFPDYRTRPMPLRVGVSLHSVIGCIILIGVLARYGVSGSSNKKNVI